jgi:sulfatase modifying factor 1
MRSRPNTEYATTLRTRGRPAPTRPGFVSQSRYGFSTAETVGTLFLSAALVGGVVGCRAIVGITDLQPDDAASHGIAIDPTEVTQAQYQQFLATQVPTEGQEGLCSWNTSYAPAVSPDCDPPNDPNYLNRPIICIDWCDAVAYCKWAGRHLCGRIGGGSILPQDGNDPAKSEWYAACSKGGSRPYAYPYGASYIKDKCNTGLQHVTPVDVGYYTECEGGYPGIFDMSGNVEEWEDACDSGAANGPSEDGCLIRGGAFWSDDKQSRCDSSSKPPRSGVSHDWGFRCCGEP